MQWIGYLIFIAFLASTMQTTYRVYEAKKTAGEPLPNTENVSSIQ